MDIRLYADPELGRVSREYVDIIEDADMLISKAAYIRAMTHMQDMNLAKSFFDICSEYKSKQTAALNIPAPAVSDLEFKAMGLVILKMITESVASKMITESECQQTAVSTLAPTLSDIMDYTSNHELKYQVFKVAGIHAPGDCKVDEFSQPWKDKLTKLLTIKAGSAFYVSGRTRSSDGTLYYSPPATATCHLLMVADEKGAACKSKGCYASLEDVNDVITWMAEFSQVYHFREGLLNAEHVYPGCVP